ncbi:MAG: DUF1365 domain-containing protein [Bacteroidetes bacterium]|nr:DUF1365 domain-containing protein [Bacteroidota bacterium]
MHNRIEPKPHRFHYNVFMFYIDLDELDLLSKKFGMISRNRFNFFSFRDSEHLQLPINVPDRSKSTKEHIISYLTQNNFKYTGQRIMLLTNLNILGFNFNPVSFYYVFSKDNEVECAIAEVSNTFREMKPYFFPKELFEKDKFHLNTKKYFYVSPFIEHDTNFDFTLFIPDEKLNIKIDDYKEGKRFFISTLTGVRKPLTKGNLLIYSLRFPFLTIRIMALIHWNALRLWLKKIPFHKKSAFPELQKDVYRKLKD